MDYTFEVAVDSVESALIAQTHGAHRVELCASLDVGGITPSYGMMIVARERLHIPIHAIIRPRRGDFYYTEPEFDMMRRDIEIAHQTQLNGVVIGILKSNGRIDLDRTRILIEQARPLHITFHRAFDMTRDPIEALNDLIQLGVDTVLTSGHQSSAEKGLALIRELVEYADNRINIMPGGGIHANNIRNVVEKSNATTFHFSAKTLVASDMEYRNPNLTMGANDQTSEYKRIMADGAIIRRIIENASGET